MTTDRPLETLEMLDALDADELLMLGLQAAEQQPSGSLGFFKLAVARDPGHAKAQWALAAEYAALRMPERAREHFARAVELDPEQPVARFQYGLLALTQGDVAQARSLWAALDRLHEDHPIRLFKQGLLEMVADRFDAALALVRRAMAHPGVDTALRQDMAMTLDNIEAAACQAGVETAAPEARPMESYWAISAYGGGSSGGH